jgi:predicted pyridoxine 5'-phosphate oxidase superfamily flavin-nucleotide-binding protein
VTGHQGARHRGIAVELQGFAGARDELLRLTRTRQYAALATSTPDGRPEAAPLRYMVTDDFELVMGTLRTSRKYANLRRNPDAAVVVWDDEFSIQIEGAFDEPVGADRERVASLFTAEFPVEARLRAGRPQHFYFRITPRWARYSDFSDEPPRVLTLDFSAETETRETFPVIAEN